MRHVLFLPLLSILMLPENRPSQTVEKKPDSLQNFAIDESKNECTLLRLQQEPGNMKMLAVEFKTREWCRAELKILCMMCILIL